MSLAMTPKYIGVNSTGAKLWTAGRPRIFPRENPFRGRCLHGQEPVASATACGRCGAGSDPGSSSGRGFGAIDAAAEDRLALLQEGPHALGIIGREAGLALQLALEVELGL